MALAVLELNYCRPGWAPTCSDVPASASLAMGSKEGATTALLIEVKTLNHNHVIGRHLDCDAFLN